MVQFVKAIKDVKKFTIKRSEWRRGEGTSTLLGYDNKKCCLGFYAQACGIPEKFILHIGTPATLNCSFRMVDKCRGLFWDSVLVENSLCNSSLSCHLMITNDADYKEDAAREKEIKQLFLSKGIVVNFID